MDDEKYIINCAECGHRINIAGVTGRYLLVRPCQNCIKSNREKGEFARKADFEDLEKRFLKFRYATLNDIAEIVRQINDK